MLRTGSASPAPSVLGKVAFSSAEELSYSTLPPALALSGTSKGATSPVQKGQAQSACSSRQLIHPWCDTAGWQKRRLWGLLQLHPGLMSPLPGDEPVLSLISQG